jgi:histidinol-phosphate aminotransferase
MRAARFDPAVPIQPATRAADARAYARAQRPQPIDLRLDANEGPAPGPALAAILAEVAGQFTRARAGAQVYPNAGPLEALLAERLGVGSEQVVVTAGADDALGRIAAATLEPGRSAVCTRPTFEMIPRYIALAGARAVEVGWLGGMFHVEQIIDSARAAGASVVFIVSPNNPTGGVVSGQQLEAVARALPGALIVVDQAYAEFGGEDLTAAALRLPNAVVTRTFSKAWGLAGLRVGYAVGPAAVVGWVRGVGQPYAVSGYSLEVARRWLAAGAGEVGAYVARVREERDELSALLARLGAGVIESSANLVLARFRDAALAADMLAGLGIAVRAYGGHGELRDYLRIGLPGSAAGFERLAGALGAALRPEAVLFDLDGVLADVSGSYRAAIVATARELGVEIGREEIVAAKAAGGANNDWVLTQRLLAERGVAMSLEEVTARFERWYQGDGTRPGLRETERALWGRAGLEAFKRSRGVKLAIVTGRPRADAERFLREHDLAGCFESVVCMEDGPSKPDPAVVRLAMARLGVTRGWMIGDTVDDVRAARGAGVVPIGVCPPGEELERSRATLQGAGAARVLERAEQLRELEP